VRSAQLEELELGGERGRVRQRAREQASRERGPQSQQALRGQREREPQGQHAQHEQVGLQPAGPEGAEEGRAAAQTDGVDEEHQTEQVDDLRQLEVGVQRADADADEEHRGDTERAARHAHAPQRVADTDDDEQQQERVVEEELDHGSLGPS
jgi:hypothetical protein